LKLEEGRGLIVNEVIPGGPAAGAGVEVHDVILSLGGKAVGRPEDLVGIVRCAPESPLEIQCIRAGETKTIAVTPRLRPADGPFEIRADGGRVTLKAQGMEANGERILWFGNPGDAGPHRLQIVGPALLYDARLGDLPKGTKVTIEKSGKEPASIVVENEEGTWKAKEGKLEALPPSARGAVEQMLRRDPAFGAAGGSGAMEGAVFGPPALRSAPAAKPPKQVEPSVKAVRAKRIQIEPLKADVFGSVEVEVEADESAHGARRGTEPDAARLERMEREMERRFEKLERAIEEMSRGLKARNSTESRRLPRS
jgi:membrane-associated protease RseP (regulator of RpoE activity)